MTELREALERARALSVAELADTIQSIGFECTQCGACCRGESATEPHTATVYPDEIRHIQSSTGGEWRDVARPMPYGLDGDDRGETFEWALQTDACGDCTFLDEVDDGTTMCSEYDDRPAICRTYPFQVDIEGTSEPQASVVEQSDDVLAYECEGLGAEIDRVEAEELARSLKERSIREIEEAMAVLDRYEPLEAADRTIVHDSEGPKTVDGERIER